MTFEQILKDLKQKQKEIAKQKYIEMNSKNLGEEKLESAA